MTKEKYPYPKIWLDIEVCRITHRAYQRVYKQQEPLPPFETRYPGRLESVIGSVRNKAELLSYGLVKTAVAYYVQLAKSQAFYNGNKRMAIILSSIYLHFNGYYLKAPHKGFEDLTLFVSRDNKVTIEEAVEVITPIFEKLMAPLPWPKK